VYASGRARVRRSRALIRRSACYLAAARLVLLPGQLGAQLSVAQLDLVMRTDRPADRVSIIPLRNDTDRSVQAVVRLEDWDRSDDGTNRWYPQGTRPGSCGSALSVFPLAVTLEPGTSQAIRVSFDSASTATTECWAAVVVESAPSSAAVRAPGVTYILRTAVKIYVEPPGLTADGEISAFTEREEPFHGDSTVNPARQLELAFSNTGSRHVTARGVLEFRRADNSVAAKVAVPPMYALPGARRVARINAPALEPGRYIALLLLDYGGTELAAAQVDYIVIVP
jgi:P pilus assembly chaperone PapD